MIATRHSLDDARIIHKEAVSLRKAGHDVILLFMCDSGWHYRRFDGKVLATGRAPDGATSHEGFQVVGVPKRSFAQKYQQYLELARLAASQEADAYHAHEPDMALAVAIRAKALLSGRGRIASVVHDMHEYPPGTAVDRSPVWARGAAHAALMGRDKLFARRVDHVFTANSVVRGYSLMLSRHTPTDILYNGPALRLFPQMAPPRWAGSPAPLVLSHEGSLGFGRGLKEMVAAVDRLRDHVHLRIVGEVFGPAREWLEAEIIRRRLQANISSTGWLPYARVGDAVREGHAGLILFRDNLNNALAGPPNKLFNYMNAGLPILSVSFPELRRIIRDERCGLFVADQSVSAIVRGLESLLGLGAAALCDMGAAGQKAVRDRYSWDAMERTLWMAYGDIAAQREMVGT